MHRYVEETEMAPVFSDASPPCREPRTRRGPAAGSEAPCSLTFPCWFLDVGALIRAPDSIAYARPPPSSVPRPSAFSPLLPSSRPSHAHPSSCTLHVLLSFFHLLFSSRSSSSILLILRQSLWKSIAGPFFFLLLLPPNNTSAMAGLARCGWLDQMSARPAEQEQALRRYREPAKNPGWSLYRSVYQARKRADIEALE